MCECSRGTSETEGHAFLRVKSFSLHVVCQVWAAFLWNGDGIETGCEVKTMYPPVSTEASLFRANIALRHREYLCDFVECPVVLTDAPLLGLCRVIGNFGVGLWSCGANGWGFNIMSGRQALGYALFVYS